LLLAREKKTALHLATFIGVYICRNIDNTVISRAAFNGDEEIFERVWTWANEQLTKEELKELVLAQDCKKQTAWYRAVECGKVEEIDKLWEWGKGNLNRDELNNEFLLAKDYTKSTALHQAIFQKKVDILERIWKWANEQLTQEELIQLLLAENEQKETAWHLAV
jgi:endo-1,4-beta-D-glucanase Y